MTSRTLNTDFSPQTQTRTAPDEDVSQQHLGGRSELSATKKKQPAARGAVAHLYQMCTAIAIVSLLSPLAVASITFGTIPR